MNLIFTITKKLNRIFLKILVFEFKFSGNDQFILTFEFIFIVHYSKRNAKKSEVLGYLINNDLTKIKTEQIFHRYEREEYL